ncbi:probable auxin efflux carrier component 1d [Musa acuminata AAA Group]|uniref:probable auxin efflux carrier component 1d n=1 Tax=Musa acuminata AAA Group TaxID=214697 RepID=UPI0031DEF9C9
MISKSSLYHVVEAMAPLYVAMGLGYASVRFRAFTPEQCAGINHFVALFAMPLLIFRMISSNDPYAMNLRFIAADTIQKAAILAALALWARLSARGSLAWVVTLFSLATLPNTIIMGVPILRGMYGSMSGTLMVQIVVLQFAFWYVLVVFLFEYMAAQRALVAKQQQAAVPAAVVLTVLDGDQQINASAVVPVTEGDGDADTNTEAAMPPPPAEAEAAMAAPSAKLILLMAAKKILKIPSIHASMLGLVWSFIAYREGIKLPTIIDDSVAIISVSATGLATFSVGTFMAQQSRFISCGYSVASLAMAMRFLVGPAVMAASSLAVGLHGDLLHVGIVQAALPLAVISFVYAKEYNVHPEIMSTGVIVGTFASFPITIIYYILLGL